MIIVIRGTNGSGKSYTVRKILAKGTLVQYEKELSRLIRLPRVKKPVLVIGPYEKGRSMGGCDCIRQPSKIYQLIDKASHHEWHVLLEGVVLATRPYLKMHSKNRLDVRYAFLDPSKAICMANIRKRQRLRGQKHAISHEAMDEKRMRAYTMFLKAREQHMTTARFMEAEMLVRWVGYQLRRP